MYNIWMMWIRVNAASRKASKELSVAPAAQEDGGDVVMGAVDVVGNSPSLGRYS